MDQVLTVTHLSSKGDGISLLGDKKIFVPYTLPGDCILAKLSSQQDGTVRGDLIKIIEESPQRIPPACPHFTVCGSCRFQHMNPDAYQGYKTQKVITALHNQGFESPPLEQLVVLPSKTRRRANFKAVKTQDGISLGYHRRASHHIVDIRQCPVVAPVIESLLPALRLLLNEALGVKQKAEVYLTEALAGLDVLLKTDPIPELSIALREKLVDFARLHKLARLSVTCGKFEEPIVTFEAPTVVFSGIHVEIDPSGFLQASQLADEVLARTVASYLPQKFAKAADLFCGRGTFTFLLAKHAKVYAVEMDKRALNALKKASNLHQLPIHTEQRNLFSHPLSSSELNKYQVVVLNPPRIGAAKQAKQIASSHVPCVVMVSCNPTTFAHDARILREGGYQLEKITPIDQFLWSEHIELAALFKKTCSH